MTKNKVPGSIAVWVATLVNASGKSVAYGRFRSKRLQERVRRELGRLGESAIQELSRIIHGAWEEESCSAYEAQAAAAEILAIAEAGQVLREALHASLARATSTQETLLRRSLVHAIGDLGQKGAAATAEVRALLRAEDYGVRQAALVALDKICTDARKVDAAIAAALDDRDPRVQAVAQMLQRTREKS